MNCAYSGFSALVLAAGRGTRLKPFTERIPKALVPFFDVPLLELAIRKVVDAGIRNIVVNAFHLADQIESFVEALLRTLWENESFRGEVHVSRETELMGTGGAVSVARRYFDGTGLLVVNSDVVHDFDLRELLERHQVSGAEATILLRDGTDFPSLRSTRVDADGRVVEIGREGGGDDAAVFAGIYVLEPGCYRALPAGPCSVVDALLRPAVAAGRDVLAVVAPFPWYDLGSWRRYHQACMAVLRGEIDGGVHRLTPGRFGDEGYTGTLVSITPGCVVRQCVVGKGCKIQADVSNSVLLPGAHVVEKTEGSVVGPNGTLFSTRAHVVS